MRLGDEQYEEIKRTVIDNFLEYGIKCIPISAFEVATKMGIKVIPYSPSVKISGKLLLKISIDGYSMEDGNTGEWLIYYNDSCQNYGRVNQTIMHEIGHYAMGHIDDGDEEESRSEIFCQIRTCSPPLVHTLLEKITPETIMRSFDIRWEAAGNAYEYYKNWRSHGAHDYTDYEVKIINLFTENQKLMAYV